MCDASGSGETLANPANDVTTSRTHVQLDCGGGDGGSLADFLLAWRAMLKVGQWA